MHVWGTGASHRICACVKESRRSARCVWLEFAWTRDGLELERHGVGLAGLSIVSQPLSSGSRPFRKVMNTLRGVRMPRSVFTSHGAPSGIYAHQDPGSLWVRHIPTSSLSQDRSMPVSLSLTSVDSATGSSVSSAQYNRNPHRSRI